MAEKDERGICCGCVGVVSIIVFTPMKEKQLLENISKPNLAALIHFQAASAEMSFLPAPLCVVFFLCQFSTLGAQKIPSQ